MPGHALRPALLACAPRRARQAERGAGDAVRGALRLADWGGP